MNPMVALPDKRRLFRYMSSGIIVLSLVLTAAYSLMTPAWESPDEVGHFYYVFQLLTTRSLPVQQLGVLGEAHQPPLYYFIAALAAFPSDFGNTTGAYTYNSHFILAGQGGSDVNAGLHSSVETFPFQGQALALHLARGISVFMGVATVALTFALTHEIFPDFPLITLLAGALVAFNPQYLFISGSVNNDNLLTLAATAVWWQILRILKRPNQWQPWLILGVLIAIAILAKTFGLVVLAVTGMVLAAFMVQRRSPKLLFQGAMAISLPVLLVTQWWFIRNQILYGDPLGWGIYEKVYDVNLRHSPLQWNDLIDMFSTQFRSFWGVFGWMNITPPDWFYAVYQILGLAGLVGIIFFTARRSQHLSGIQKQMLACLALFIVVQEAYLIVLNTRCNVSCYQGRYLFPIIGPLAVMISWGLTSLFPRRIVSWLVGGLMIVLIGIAVFVPLRVISPAYRIAAQPKWALWFVPYKTDITFGHMFELKGYDVSKAQDGTSVKLTLYWQAASKPDFNYSVFAHLIDGSDRLIAQQDHAPGETLQFPPVAWSLGDIIADEHLMAAPSPLAQGTYRLRVGVYRWDTGEQLAITSKGLAGNEFVVLDQTVTLGSTP
ncbi:MAG: DUF2142 domain-containing protein [Chloroflexi bacterium]|nr:DUF2142 domain-containing protein [Chloroflexota bacterium]